jgi:hypothetical protein
MKNTAALKSDRIAAVLQKAAEHDGELVNLKPLPVEDSAPDQFVDALVCTDADSHAPEIIFDRLRWGGHLIFISADRDVTLRFSMQLANAGFAITTAPTFINRGPFGWPIPFLSRKTHYFVARKIHLVHPGETTDRFTYHVYLSQPKPDAPFVVAKEVPTHDMVMARLRSKWPELPEETLQKRARKFSEKIFPIFLTREAAILKILQRDIPKDYRDRIPRLLEMEKDARGFVSRVQMNWLRNGGKPLTQLEFARQSADLLRVLHDEVGVMHLDLRLDNFVITPAGVGFVDFGSAVRVDEDLKENPLLSNLFEELMRTSEIQRMLVGMTRTGQVTSQALSCGVNKVDKAVDCFYLAMQISTPHNNPDLRDLIVYDPRSEEAKALKELTEKILRPVNLNDPPFRSAADILRGIETIAAEISRRPTAMA